MYKTPTPPSTTLNSKPAIVRNLSFRSYRSYFTAIIFLLALNLLKDTNVLVAPANASGANPVSVTLPAKADTIPTAANKWAHLNEPYAYRLVLQDEYSFVLMDGDRIVHVFQRAYKPNGNLFYVVDRDNE